MTDIEAPPFGGYEFATGRFRIKGLDLSVYRHWGETILEPASGGKFNTSITGKAVSKNDKVCLIGEDRDESEFALELKSDAYAKEDWEVSRRLEELATPHDRRPQKGGFESISLISLAKPRRPQLSSLPSSTALQVLGRLAALCRLTYWHYWNLIYSPGVTSN